MKKTLKWTGILLGSLIALLAVAAVALVLLVDPNQYKGEIIKTVKEKTGRDLRIDGKIRWSFLPRVGVEAGGLSLSNAPGFDDGNEARAARQGRRDRGFGAEPMAKIGTAGVRVRLLPLLGGRIVVDTVYAGDVTLNLARDKAGRTNWQDLAGDGKPAKPAAAAPASKQSLAGLTVGRLDLKRINLHWHDQGTGERIAVRDLSLATGRFEAGKPFSLNLALQLVRDKAAPIPVKLAAQVTADADALKLSGLDLAFDESRITGTLAINRFSAPILRAELKVDRFDLDRYRAPARDAAAAPAAAGVPGGDVALPLGLLRSLNLKAGLKVGNLKAFGIRVSDLDTRVSAQGGLIQFGPNKAALYGGQYQGQTSLDARGAVPALRMDEKLAGVQLGNLLKDMGLFGKFTGEAGVTVNLGAQGSSVNALKRTLTGTITVDSRDGRIEGVNLAKTIQDARKLGAKIAGKPVEVAPASGDNTAFKTLHATLRVKNGVAQNDDFRLDGAQVRAAGKGSVDLVQEKLDYRLQVTVAEGEDRKGTTLPLSITGGFAKLKFGVDLGAQVKQQATKKVEEKLRGLLRKKR